MPISEKTGRFLNKRDIVNLAILLAIAAGVGIYLIATTVLIAEDGAYYIEQAQKFSQQPVDVIKADPPFGYTFLIFAAHKLISAFSDSLSLYVWIYSAQCVSLVCRLLAIVFLYFIGKFLVSSSNSFWAVLIFVLLPYPAKFGSDVLRDWPHLLFLAAGFLLLLWAAMQDKWLMFGAVGLAAGLGYMIRNECAQLVIYGILWLLIRFFFPTSQMSRTKVLCALLVLFAGFSIFIIPYMKVSGRILPVKLKNLLSFSCRFDTCSLQEPKIDGPVCFASALPVDAAKAVGSIFQELIRNLMYYFLPALLIGIYYHFRRGSSLTAIERFFILVFIAFNFLMLILLFHNYGYVSRRHVLPLVAFTIFYVPVGLSVMSSWITARLSKGILQTHRNQQLWFFVLLGIGICISLPNLFTPIRAEKQIYRIAAKWLAQNTDPKDVIAAEDGRISFYAGREGLEYFGSKIPKGAGYVVKVVDSFEQQPDLSQAVQEEQSWWLDKQKREKLVVYRVMRPQK